MSLQVTNAVTDFETKLKNDNAGKRIKRVTCKAAKCFAYVRQPGLEDYETMPYQPRRGGRR